MKEAAGLVQREGGLDSGNNLSQVVMFPIFASDLCDPI
jgi:hypothetical protein